MTATKKATAKKAASSVKDKVTGKANKSTNDSPMVGTVNTPEALATGNIQQVEPREDLTSEVPPVNTHEALNAVNYEGHEDKPDSRTEDQEFIYPTHTDPNRRIPGTNPYLDDVERERAEIHRARVEGRDPDLENPGSYQGSPLVSKTAFLAANAPYTSAEGVPVVELPVVIAKD
jgi:hypothetical protein